MVLISTCGSAWTSVCLVSLVEFSYLSQDIAGVRELASLRLEIEMHAECRQDTRDSLPDPRMRGWDVAALEPPLVYPRGLR